MVLNRRQIFFILVSVCFLLYANSLNNAFVSDDLPGILSNPDISKGYKFLLEPNSLLNSFTYLIGKYNVILYHLINIALHSLNTILVFIFLRLFFGVNAAFLGSCLFAAHPIHTEAVAWPSGKPYIILSLFILSAYLLYYRASYKDTKLKIPFYLLSFLVFLYYIIGHVSFYVVFPFFLILSDITFKRWRRNWKLWIPFLVVVVIRVFFERSHITMRVYDVTQYISGGNPVWISPFIMMSYSLFSNFMLTLFPAALTIYHEPAIISPFYVNWGIICLLVLAIALLFLFKRAKEIFFGAALFILFLAPTYSPVPVAWLIAERYLYFPSIALSIFLAYFYEQYVLKLPEARRQTVIFAIVLIIASYAVRTVVRNEDWKTPERFWRQTLETSYKSPRAHNNMGDIYCQEGNAEGALKEFSMAIKLKPDYADAYHNLATAYQRVGNLDQAFKFYEKAAALDPNLFESQYNLAIFYLNSGQLDKAEERLKRAEKLRPGIAEVKKAMDFIAGKKAQEAK